jgi:hypothetical protein
MPGGSGGGGVTWSSEERASAGWGAAARVLGRHVAQREAARGQLVLGTWPARAAGHRREQKQREGDWRYMKGDLAVPKSKSVELT